MLKTLGIVQPYCGPEEVDSKTARRLGGKSILEWVVRHVTEAQRLDGVIVILGESAAERRLAELVPSDVPVCLSSHGDPLARFVAAAESRQAQAVVRVCTRNPFFDPVWIDHLVSTADAHAGCDYISYCSGDGRPTILSPLGIFAEWCSVAALHRADASATRPADRASVTRYLYSHPDQFLIRLIPAPEQLDRNDVRLKLDVEEDWEHAQVIYDALGPDEWNWQRIAGLLDHQPELRKRMEVLNRVESK